MRRPAVYLVGLVTLAACNDNASPPSRSSATAPPVAETSPSPSPPLPASAAPSAASSAAVEPRRPLYYARAITADDLKGRSLRELSLMRNTIYARAGNSFRRPWLKKHFTAQNWYEPRKVMDASKLTELDRKNAQAVADHDAGLTREHLEARRDEVLARRRAGAARPGDEVEISLLSQRLGEWLLQDDEGGRPPTPLEDPTRLDELLTVDDLDHLSRRDLRILRNTVYARKGRTFSSKVVRSYFATAAWYEPRDDYRDSLLTRVDHKNVALIRSVEDSLGGPLHENPNFGKEGWFFAA